MTILISIFLGIGLSASVGFRVFIPLLCLSIAAYMGFISLTTGWEWAGSLTAIIILGVAALVEILAYYIPVVDNLLDSITVPLAAVAGTAIMVSVLGDLHPAFTWALAIIAGGGTAATVATTTSTARLTSTSATGGLANPIISTTEAGFSSILSILALIAPFVAVLIVILILISIRSIYRKMFKKNTLSRKRNNNNISD